MYINFLPLRMFGKRWRLQIKKKNTPQKVSYEDKVFARNLKNPGNGYDACISRINENAKKNFVTKHYFDDGRVEVEVTEEKGDF